MKKIIYAIIFLTMISFVYGACVVPTDGTTISGNVIICFNESPYTATDAGNNGFLITSGAVNLDCNGSILNGDGTGYGIFSNNNNVNITNCKFNGYDRGIGMFADNFKIFNNTFTNNTNGIVGNGADDNFQIYSNLFINNTDTLETGVLGYNNSFHDNEIYTRGRVFFSTSQSNISIYNNNYYNFDGNAMLISASSKDFKIYNNKINHLSNTSEVIRMNGLHNSSVYNNEIVGGGYAIYSNNDCKNLTVYSNKLNDSMYAITIDSTTDSIIYDNIMIETSWLAGSHGLMLTYDAIGNTGYRNNLSNFQFGLLFEHGSYNNVFYNNNVDNTRISLYDLHDTKWNYAYNNTLDCNETGDYAGIKILDNVTSSRYVDNYIECNLAIKHEDTVNNITHKNSYVKGLSNTYITYEEITATGDINLTNSYANATLINYSCDGIASIKLDLETLQGKYGYYATYLSGALYEYSNTDSYIATCADWKFLSSSYRQQDITVEEINDNASSTFLFLSVAVIIFAIVTAALAIKAGNPTLAIFSMIVIVVVIVTIGIATRITFFLNAAI